MSGNTSVPPPAVALTANAGLLPVGAPTVAPGSTVLTVGVGKEFSTIGAAVSAAQNGDTVLVDAGTYTNDFATITSKITIEGVGGMVNLVATVPPPNSKGIFTVDNDATIENLSFSGSAISAANGGNGAGIRYEGGQMVLVNDSFSNNQDGILGSPVLPNLTVNTISIDHSVFADNGSGSGYTHNLYVGAVSKLTATNSIFEGAVVGHEFKSRALVNDIENNIFRDGPTGTASYDIDLPNGGTDLVKNNVVEKGPDAENDAMVHFGGEGIPYAGSSLTLTGNDFVNDKGSSTVAVLNQTAITVAITGNAFTSIAAGQIVQGPATGTNNTDGNGQQLPDFSLVGVLPGNTTIFTDNNPHSIVLSSSGEAVEGGGGLLTVSDPAGHIVAIGGSGGMNFTEGPGSGGNSISTLAGSTNTISVVGQDVIDSEGTDAITVGSGNITGVVGGNATIAGTGNDQWAINGTARVTGNGGSPNFSVGPQGNLTLTGTLGYLAVQNNGGTVSFDAVVAGTEEAMSITGGAVQLRTFNNAMNVTTAAGPNGTTLRIGTGTALVSSLGADVIYAGSGADTVIVSGHAVVYAGTGTLALFGRGDTLGATFYGNGGDYTLDGDSGNITYYGGAAASTIEAALSNNTLNGGAGRLTVNGGSMERINGGSGGITYSANGGGANTITTAAGARDTLTLAGADVVTSRGSDTIFGGSGNQSMTIYGNSTIFGSTGTSNLSFYGTDTLIGQGGDWCTLNAGAQLSVTAGALTNVNETAAKLSYTVSTGAYAGRAYVTGSATVSGGTTSAIHIVTSQGASTSVMLGIGAIGVTLQGADTLQAGLGSDTITITSANTNITGSSGALTVHDYDGKTGDGVTIHGGSGAVSYDQGGAALTFIGGSGSAVLAGGWGSLSVKGGSGSLNVSGGNLGLQFVAGTGLANIALTPSGGNITFGAGATSVQVAGYGAADQFRFVSGTGGGTDTITGFRTGTDQLLLQGVGIRSQTVAGGSTSITLTDNTHLQLVGVTNLGHV